jgi:hypothetical protein
MPSQSQTRPTNSSPAACGRVPICVARLGILLLPNLPTALFDLASWWWCMDPTFRSRRGRCSRRFGFVSVDLFSVFDLIDFPSGNRSVDGDLRGTGTDHFFVSRSHMTFLRPLSPGSMPSLRMALFFDAGQLWLSGLLPERRRKC